MSEDGSRILLGDAEGLLHLLTINIRNNTVDGLCFIGLGNVSCMTLSIGRFASY